MPGTSQAVLDSLNVDLSKEHGAIIQYLIHGAQVRDSVLRCSIFEAAREEMWHMEWLTEAIRDRGGASTLDRQESIFASEGIVRNLQADVDAESDALAHYEKTLATIRDTDEELTTLINRIMDDERAHRTSFTMMADRVGADGEPAFLAKPAISPTDAGNSAPMIGLEYEGLLQYLQNKYGVEDRETAETYFELAINEMRHLKWVATCYGGLPPQIPPNPKDRVAMTEGESQAFQRAEQYEGKAQQTIAAVSGKLAGTDIKNELGRIDFQHAYHRFQLAHMSEPAKTRPS
jgi:bacterioferritin